jgi:tetratricopeptide (TPR) repeat protein
MKLIPLLFFLSSFAVFSQINDQNNRFMLGESYEQAGDFLKAKSIYEDLYKSNSSNFLFFDALNKIYIQLKEYENSVKIISEKLKSSPDDINLYGLLGKTYYIAGDEKKAFEIWDEGLTKDPANQSAFRVIANYAIERRAFDKAVDMLEKGKQNADDPTIYAYDLGNLYSLTMRFEEAAEEYCSILAVNPNQLRSVESRILSYIHKPGAIDKTIDVIKECSGGEQINYDYLLARLYIEKKDFNKAFDLYLQVDEKLNNQGSELFNFAQLLLNEGEYEVSAKVFNEIIQRYPASPFLGGAKLGYAKTMEESLKKEIKSEKPDWKPYSQNEVFDSEKIDEIIDAYNKINSSFPNTEIANESLFRTGYVKYYFQNNPEEAEEIFNKIITESPLSKLAADSFRELGNISLEKGDLNKASEYFLRISENKRIIEETRSYAKYKIARINFYNGNFNEVKEILNSILTNLKDNTANDAIELSMLINTKMNDSTNLLKFAEAEFLIEKKQFNEAAEIFKNLSEDKNAFLLKNLACLRYGEMELALDDYTSSVNILNIISEETTMNIYADKALYLLGRIYKFGLKDIPKAIEVFEKLLAKFPNSLYLDEARSEIIELRNKLS